uniref:Major capsid protein N-terminal domain-containing protein n=1 Tax=viral metagenome TaxID=1070528 RepID=A0A6C0E6Q0_9ZZZZ
MDATYRQLDINTRNERLDKFLTANPEVSFFHSKQKRYYPYARNARYITFDSAPEFGQLAQVKIPRYGHLVGDIAIEFDLPTLTSNVNVSYCNNIGHALIDWIEIEIGGIVFDRLYGLWLHICREIFEKKDQRDTHRELTYYFENMTTNSFPGGEKVIVPLNFWFNKIASHFLPLSAISNQDVIIKLKLNPFSKLWVSDNSLPPNGTYKLTNLRLLVDYYVLDDHQQRMFSPIYDNDHNVSLYPPKLTYLITQTQRIQINIPSGKTKVSVDMDSFNYPVAFLIWVLRRIDVSTNNDWFNFTNVLTGTPSDPLQKAQLYHAEKERTDEISAKILRLYEPLKFVGHSSNNYIYTYFFNLYPNNKTQPSGSSNFSFMNDSNLVLSLIDNLPEMELHLYAVNYNMMNIDKGTSWLEYILSN